jgi:hypothetical protein
VVCTKAVCPECKVEYEGRVYCNPCIQKMAAAGGLDRNFDWDKLLPQL